MAVTDVIFKIKAIDKATKPVQNVTKGFRKADRQANTLNKTVTTLGKTMRRAFALLAVAKVVKDVVTLGVNMEQTRVAFGTFLGDVEKGNALIAQLNTFANVTPFNNAEVIKSGRVLLSAGVAAEQVTTHLKRIGDVAAGANVPLEELSAIYTKALNKGKLQAEELNQFSERGIPLLDTLAKGWNITKGEVLKLGEQGKITSDVMQNAFATMTNEGGIFFNLMEKQSKTLGGRFSTLVGTLQTVGIAVGEALITPLGKGVEVLQTVVNFFRERAQQLKQVFAPVVRSLQPFIDVLKNIREQLGEAGGTVGVLEGAFNTLGNALLIIEPILTGLWQVFAAVLEVSVNIVSTFKEFISTSGTMQNIIGGLVGAFTAFFETIKDGAVETLGGIGNLVTGILSGDLEQIKDALKGLGSAIVTKLNPVAQGINAARGFSDGFKTGLDPTAFNFFPDLTDAAGAAATGLNGGGPAGALSSIAATGATGTAASTRGDLKAGISEVKAGAPKTFNINIDSLIEAFNINTTNMEQTPQKVADEVKKALLTVLADTNAIAS